MHYKKYQLHYGMNILGGVTLKVNLIESHSHFLHLGSCLNLIFKPSTNIAGHNLWISSENLGPELGNTADDTFNLSLASPIHHTWHNLIPP